jgi:predicted MFS family arabinose efflux permease
VVPAGTSKNPGFQALTSPRLSLQTYPLKHSLRIQILAFTAVRTVLNIMHRLAYPFLPILMSGLGVDLPTISRALTFRALLGAFSPFLASVADSRGRKSGMVVGLLVFSLGLSVVSIWPTFPAFVASLLLAAGGKYIFDPSMQAYLGDRVAYQRRGLALAVTEYSWSLAFILGIPLMGLLIARWGWRAPFPFLAMAGLISIVFLGWLVPKDPMPDQRRSGIWRNLRMVLTNKPALLGLLLGLLMSTANEIINLIFGVWIEDLFGLKIAALGAAAVVIGMAEFGGETLVGLVTDRLGKPRSVASGILLNCLAVLMLPLFGRSLAGALVGLFLFYITFEFGVVSALPLMTEIMPTARATFMAATVAGFALGRALGAFLAPPLYSWGIFGSGIAAVVFNLLALLSLYLLTVSEAKMGKGV